MMNIDLTGQAGVVTGAGRGIGRAVTRALTASGAHVIAGTPRSWAGLDKVAAEGTATTPKVGAVYLLAIGNRYTATYGQQHKAAACRCRRDAGDAG
jgi:NAD(P)-dependent dehydrogenase (short-subunit alcohol dehydrogenase family)